MQLNIMVCMLNKGNFVQVVFVVYSEWHFYFWDDNTIRYQPSLLFQQLKVPCDQRHLLRVHLWRLLWVPAAFKLVASFLISLSLNYNKHVTLLLN